VLQQVDTVVGMLPTTYIQRIIELMKVSPSNIFQQVHHLSFLNTINVLFLDQRLTKAHQERMSNIPDTHKLSEATNDYPIDETVVLPERILIDI